MQKVAPTWPEAYKRWARLNKWIFDNSKKLNRGQKDELVNSVTRYYISISFRPATETDAICKKFLSELESKSIKIAGDIRKIAIGTIAFMPSSFGVQNGLFKCGDFYGTLSPERYNLLKSRGSDAQILSMLLEYAMYPSPSLSWQIPKAVYQCMVEKHGLTLEGCASPINSQVLEFGKKYCSPSFATDEVFGSVGDLFATDLDGEVAMINPPFVEDFMEAVAIKIEATLNNAKKNTTIVFVGPNWSDAKFYTLLSGSTHLKETHQLTKGAHSYEDSGTGKKIPARFNSTIFVLSNVEVSIADVLQHFK